MEIKKITGFLFFNEAFDLFLCVRVVVECVRLPPPCTLTTPDAKRSPPDRKSAVINTMVPKELGILDAKSLTTLTACSTLLYVSVGPNLYTVPSCRQSKDFRFER